ncbi:ABC1-domain-containing protein [Punctularia strigosozonata HHB-11173 SS5]|uniref:ABC1-domain-containing protein n=1 Tax=Punctularia strigosozonata (strain HHB-11173) TaxID=741275 RepID=UPI0004416CBB|nr:ABC1-domain-containing protein [Punctularia strigosozonata HHB-11173 SS5]EIN11810.1 ABC1-domain-containing protein [Punctularia strigosozonata HHB-11173 SS5]
MNQSVLRSLRCSYQPLRSRSIPLYTYPRRTLISQPIRWSHSTSGNGHTAGNSQRRRKSWAKYSGAALAVSVAGWIAYENTKPFRYAVLAGVRCSRVAAAAIAGVVDYKVTFAKTYASEDQKQDAYSACHKRSAQRVLRALLANGGIFIKLGQHMSSLIVLPVEWTTTMRPLQDQCEPTPYEAVDALFMSDMGQSIPELFEGFDPKPIGVASLAQVHVARHKSTGQEVAVKIQHPHLVEFCDIDMNMVEVTLGWIKYWFPEFEFTWLADEMRQNLPKEMNFAHEASNAARAKSDFEGVRTSLYIPEVIYATKRVLIMEYIRGRRVDDLEYLADHNIDRNKVSIELARIFARMVHINGWFHADPHAGNLLIRPSPRSSKSPYNFEIVLLDHGLYFDLDTELRVNYSRYWLSLIAPASPQTNADRRKYAEAFANIGPDLYPIFEAALTGRTSLEGTWEEEGTGPSWRAASSMLDVMPQTEEELDAMRHAVVNREGLILSVFDVLRRVPRRVLMVLKLNDLTRSLDHALKTTHSNVRVFLVMSRYCARAVWRDDRRRLFEEMREKGFLSLGVWLEYVRRWWQYEKTFRGLGAVETYMDLQAWRVKTSAYLTGLWKWGFVGAHLAAAGLADTTQNTEEPART